MKTREFDINNYEVEDIIKEKVKQAALKYPAAFKHDFLLGDSYETKKEKTIKEWEALKAKCDVVFEGDKQYAKLLQELEHLYYCQAYTALSDFYSKKITSKSVSNSCYQARAMSYSTISCD